MFVMYLKCLSAEKHLCWQMQVDPYCENMDSDTLFVVFPLCTNTVNIKSIRLKCRLSSLSQRVKNIPLILGAVPQKISNGTRDKKSHLIKWGGAKQKKKKKRLKLAMHT